MSCEKEVGVKGGIKISKAWTGLCNEHSPWTQSSKRRLGKGGRIRGKPRESGRSGGKGTGGKELRTVLKFLMCTKGERGGRLLAKKK